MRATIEQLIQEEAQELLNSQAAIFRLPFDLRVAGLRTENAMYVLPVKPSGGYAKNDPQTEVARQMMTTLLSYVGMKMEEDHPGLRILLLPEFGRSGRAGRSAGRNGAHKNRKASSRKGR